MTDYLAASSDEELPQSALTPNSTPADAAGMREILAMITNPKAHQAALDEQRAIKAERADLAKAWRELRQAKAVQADELAQIRKAFDDAMATDKANHIGAIDRERQKFAAMLAELKQKLGPHAD